MSSFLNELEKGTNKTARTENGAVTNNSTLSATLDYFSLAGAMRNRAEDTSTLFAKAYSEDKTSALRILFYLRDVRGGQGERDVFSAGLKELVKLDLPAAEFAINYISEYGRYDDLLSLIGTEAEPAVIDLIKGQLDIDLATVDNDETTSVSLLAKWLPSENASSKKSREQANKIAQALDMKPRQYRKVLSALRARIKLLEHKMSRNEWGDIEYSALPSQASRKHVGAFMRHDVDRYKKYLESVKKGESKINTSTLYTYEVYNMVNSAHADTAEVMWANLPDYTNDNDALVVADVSGSMYGTPISVSVSLALYYAERNKGIFANKFMTFSRNPQLVSLPSSGSLSEKIKFIERQNWDMNTNLEAVFDTILKAAVASGDSEGMPKTLYIISDMEFDQCVSANDTIFNNARNNFAAAGFKLPHVVFWNVNARANHAPATKFDGSVSLVSGLSQSVFQVAVAGKDPIESMNEIIGSERYAQLVI